jgi:hypothetical protein
MYLSPQKLTQADKTKLHQIIRLVDTELLHKWLNEIVPNIYALQRHMVNYL